MDRQHENAIHIRGRDRRRASNSPDSIVTKCSEEVLGHWTVVTKLFGVLTDVVPACYVHGPDLSERLFCIDRLEILFCVLVGDRAVRGTFDYSHLRIPQADFVTGIDLGVVADGRGVGQALLGDIGECSCAWRINRIKRLSEFGTSLDSASATGTNRDQ